MNKEYESIRSKTIEIALDSAGAEINAGTVIDAVRAAVESCYKLASKPPKDLTGDEKYDLWLSCYGGKFSRDDFRCESGSEVVDKIIAGYLAKQREPERVTVKVRFWRHTGNAQNMAEIRSYTSAEEYLTSEFPGGYTNAEWLGPEQSFEVVLP